MAAVAADKHAAVWYLLNTKNLSSNAQRAMDDAAKAGDPVYVSSISLVEIVYLVEKGKLPPVSEREAFEKHRRANQESSSSLEKESGGVRKQPA